MALNRKDHSRIEPAEHQPDPSKKSMFGSIANRIGQSASGLISGSLLRPDPLSVCSSLAFIGSDSNKAPPTLASSSTYTSSSFSATRELTRDDTWLAPSIPQDQEKATQANHLEQWRYHPRQNTITSEFDDFVSDSKRTQAQPREATQKNQSSSEHIFHARSFPRFAASQIGQSQAGALTDESCRESKTIPLQLSTDCFFTSIRDRASPEDFTPEWKRLHTQHFGDIQKAQYSQKPGHRTTTDGARFGLQSPRNVVHLPNMADTPSDIPDDGAEVVSLLSDPEFCPGGGFNDQLQYSIDELLPGEESWLTGASASTFSQSRETLEPDTLFRHLETKAAPSTAALLRSPSEGQMAYACDYSRFPARYIEEVWGFFASTKPKRLARLTVPSGALKKDPQWNGANDKGRTTALNRLVMVLNHLGPNPTKFGAQN